MYIYLYIYIYIYIYIYNMSMCINPSIPCMSPIAKNTPYFFILPLIFTIAKNYSLVLNFTPYFHAQGVNYSFGKTLVRALHTLVFSPGELPI